MTTWPSRCDIMRRSSGCLVALIDQAYSPADSLSDWHYVCTHLNIPGNQRMIIMKKRLLFSNHQSDCQSDYVHDTQFSLSSRVHNSSTVYHVSHYSAVKGQKWVAHCSISTNAYLGLTVSSREFPDALHGLFILLFIDSRYAYSL